MAGNQATFSFSRLTALPRRTLSHVNLPLLQFGAKT
jgi:hypothetical protein